MIYKAIIASPTIFISWFWSSALISIFKHLSPSRTISSIICPERLNSAPICVIERNLAMEI